MKTTVSDIAVPVEKPTSSVSFRFHKKHGHMLPEGLTIGKKHQVKMTGKITGIRSDEYGHSMDMDLDTMGADDERDMPRSMTQAMKRRHMGSGRFTK